ncbi:MBL fold metallo-hydrolase [Herbiconiux sp. KACC 21604]|uniref:MBL fold metallo-hydrolase n=1 Tax=unclassified Herbiconiux TaxID=2618217 RepID=UPI001491FAF7|nr:MBL fold metallo-hydrolase [Herbiconiux sp. SALV-R1]QJU55311.1 MBL fold metallo-hydrolase [Herbiconiux sp. SALV-R1]WPO86479.1 MBL fold metallo-hydrolase [Herbiconiux sp. KACC 21604]
MKITHYGHACVLLETDAARALIDPGAYCTGFDELRDLDLVLITHQHPDHVAPERLAALLEANPRARVVTNAGVAEALGLTEAIVVAAGDVVEENGLRVRATGEKHGAIHALVPDVVNTGFVVDDLVWHPGDSFDGGEQHAPVLLVPAGGPWMKIGEAVDFVRAERPRVAVPIHQAGLAAVHRELHYSLLGNLAPEGTTLLVLEEGTPTELPG